MPTEHILIVGGTKGAGRIAVRAFRSKNCKVSVIARNLPPQPARKVSGVYYWSADILDSDALQKTLEVIWRQVGRITGVVFFQRFRGAGDVWNGEIQTSLYATKHLIDTLVGKYDLRGASIVIVSSMNAHLISKHLSLGYHVAKAGLNQMVRYYAVTLGGRGIRINSVSPGTFLKEESKALFLQDRKLVRLYESMIPLGRICTVEEVVQIVVFLCGEMASFVTGQDIIVDGGLSLIYQEALARELTMPLKKNQYRPRK